MKRIKITYWILSGIMSALLGIGAIFDMISAPAAVEHITHLGYPAYLVPFLGVAKLLGIIAILLPGFPRIKEWAYAGLVFDLTGALYSHISIGEAPGTWMPLLIGLLLIAASYVFYHRKIKATSLIEINQGFIETKAI